MDIKERILLLLKTLGVSKAEFERRSSLSNGYLNNFKGSLGANKLENILKAFPEINRDWLLNGEGEMLKTPIIQHNQAGDNINGQSVTISQTETEKLLDVINSCHEIIRKKDEQIDKLLTIIGNSK